MEIAKYRKPILIAFSVVILLVIYVTLTSKTNQKVAIHPNIEFQPSKPILFDYIEIISGCGPSFDDTCANAYSETDASSTPALQLRKGIVLKVAETIVNPDRTWYKIEFDEWLRYPERVHGDLYVPADHVRLFSDEGVKVLDEKTATSTKKIVVDRSLQMLYAYDGEELFMEQAISTGILLTPTPRGIFKVFKKTPSRYMQGPIIGLNSKYYDLPGVPWDLYFTEQGGAIHGTYWHDHFGERWSSGCVNVPPEQAKILYEWAEVGTTVLVRD